jgi:peptide/nickel transport system substrate-binding protein
MANQSARLAGSLIAGVAIALALLATASADSGARAKEGGTLVVGLGFGEPDLDPTKQLTFSGIQVLRTLCERLYKWEEFEGKMRVVPQLATAMPVISKDRRTYTIALRKGVLFNDGTPFNAQAVVTTIERDKTLPGSLVASDFAPVDSVTASGPYTVVFHLSTPFTVFLNTLASSPGPIMSPTQLAKLGANFAAHPVGVGPFMFDNRVAGDSVTVVKSPYYYDKSKVHLEKIVFKGIADAAAAAAALKAGDLQALDVVSPAELPGVRVTSGVRLLGKTPPGFQGVVFNIGNKRGVGRLPYVNLGTPFASSAKLRKAFDEAIDRRAVGNAVLIGEMVPGCTHNSPSSIWFDPTVVCSGYDRADARKLIRASNVTNPTVNLLTSNLTDSVRLAQALQAVEAAVGINVVIETTDAATAVTRAGAGKFEAYLTTWYPGGLDADTNLYKFFHTTGSRNRSGYSNAKVDSLLDEARQAPTFEARKSLYHQVEQIVVNNRPMIVLFHAKWYAAVSTRLTGVQFPPDANLRIAFAQFK